MENYIKQAKQIIEENIYMVISSASLDGRPWISPVFFAYDNSYNFFWVSNKDSRHSALIRSNPHVAIVIFDSRAPQGKGDGVYFEAKIDELSEKSDIAHAMEILSARVTIDEFRIKKIEEVMGGGVWRVYRANPIKIYKLAEGTHINGQYVDTKVEIELVEKSNEHK